ncbi:MAG: prephenate dehydrogenase [Treponema sp.]|jgi:prephenate dehydrogenase|nr:prephenate dehydrogenase [Treponema sp.]
MKPFKDCVAGIAGMGIMGGAFAMALGRLAPRRLLACDTGRKPLDAALADKVIDEGFTDAAAMLRQCDFLYLCINPSQALPFMETHISDFKRGALITDIAGVKGTIAHRIEVLLREDLDYIPGHPMAGSEKGGYEQAKKCVFRGKNYILTPLKRNKKENLEYLKDLIRRMGFGSITETTAEEHDRNIAFTSQLCHVIAAALIDSEADTAIARFGGGSFEDLTRIAMLNAPMWTELFLENRNELLKRIAQFQGSLDALTSLIAGEESVLLEERLQAVRERRAAMKA